MGVTLNVVLKTWDRNLSTRWVQTNSDALRRQSLLFNTLFEQCEINSGTNRENTSRDSEGFPFESDHQTYFHVAMRIPVDRILH